MIERVRRPAGSTIMGSRVKSLNIIFLWYVHSYSGWHSSLCPSPHFRKPKCRTPSPSSRFTCMARTVSDASTTVPSTSMPSASARRQTPSPTSTPCSTARRACVCVAREGWVPTSTCPSTACRAMPSATSSTGCRWKRVAPNRPFQPFPSTSSTTSRSTKASSLPIWAPMPWAEPSIS